MESMAYHIETSEALYYEEEDDMDSRMSLYFDEANRSVLMVKRDLDVKIFSVDGGQPMTLRSGFFFFFPLLPLAIFRITKSESPFFSFFLLSFFVGLGTVARLWG